MDANAAAAENAAKEKERLAKERERAKKSGRADQRSAVADRQKELDKESKENQITFLSVKIIVGIIIFTSLLVWFLSVLNNRGI